MIALARRSGIASKKSKKRKQTLLWPRFFVSSLKDSPASKEGKKGASIKNDAAEGEMMMIICLGRGRKERTTSGKIVMTLGSAGETGYATRLVLVGGKASPQIGCCHLFLLHQRARDWLIHDFGASSREGLGSQEICDRKWEFLCTPSLQQVIVWGRNLSCGGVRARMPHLPVVA